MPRKAAPPPTGMAHEIRPDRHQRRRADLGWERLSARSRVLLSSVLLLGAGCYSLMGGGRVPGPSHPAPLAAPAGPVASLAPDGPGVPAETFEDAGARGEPGSTAAGGARESGADPGIAAAGAPSHHALAVAADGQPEGRSGWREFRVRPGDSLSGLFARAGLSPADLAGVMALGGRTRALAKLRPGDRIHLRVGVHGELSGLSYSLDALDTLLVSTRDGRLVAQVVHASPTVRPVVARGTVRHSLALAMRRAGVAPAIMTGVVRALRWKVDFRRDIREGTRFSVLYQRLYAGGREVGTGELMGAALDIGSRRLRVFRFDDGSGEAHYYDETGHSLAPTLLRTPVRYTHISSRFARRRLNPVLHVWRPHWGVDLAAPTGTPIVAAGDGVVTFAGRDGGYGRLVTIHHAGPYATRYAHMLRFARGLRIGTRVRQGQIIGYVGRSGEATGPHLHFELRIGGRPRDPLTVALPGTPPLPPRLLEAFRRAVAPLRLALDGRDGSDDVPSLASLDHESPETGRATVEAGG